MDRTASNRGLARQLGGTECGNCWIGYVIHQAPGPMMAVAPTVELAKRNSKQRIDPLIEESDILRERVKERRSRDSGNTILSKEFPGGVLILTGANSAVGLRSMPARYLFLDEVDGYPGDVEGEGDPTGGSVTYSNNLEKIETIRDDGLIEGADPTIAALTGRIDVRFADTTLIDLAADGTPVDLEFAYTVSAQSKLILTAHEVYLPKPKLAVEGPGGVQASFDFRGAKNDVAGRMLTVTLTNDLDGTVYA